MVSPQSHTSAFVFNILLQYLYIYIRNENKRTQEERKPEEDKNGRDQRLTFRFLTNPNGYRYLHTDFFRVFVDFKMHTNACFMLANM